MEIRGLASRLLIEDEEWIEPARRGMIAGAQSDTGTPSNILADHPSRGGTG
jgi:hypothetical protein